MKGAGIRSSMTRSLHKHVELHVCPQCGHLELFTAEIGANLRTPEDLNMD
jgi:hypothetical protein